MAVEAVSVGGEIISQTALADNVLAMVILVLLVFMGLFGYFVLKYMRMSIENNTKALNNHCDTMNKNVDRITSAMSKNTTSTNKAVKESHESVERSLTNFLVAVSSVLPKNNDGE